MALGTPIEVPISKSTGSGKKQGIGARSQDLRSIT
jgi:hypothetical protein